MKHKLAINVYYLNHQPIIEVYIVSNRETKATENAAIHLTLMAIFADFGHNGFVNFLVSSSGEYAAKTFSGRTTKSPV
jgi:hypothetical protein